MRRNRHFPERMVAMKNIGFIGMGNMARAIVRGVLAGGAAEAGNLSAYAPHYDRLRAFADETGIFACRSIGELLERSDTVVMAVKPYVVEGVLAEIRESLKGKAMLSVVAGYTLERYRPMVDPSVRVQYVMPNTPCMVGEGVLLFESANTLLPEEHAAAVKLFQSLGEVVELETHLMDAATAISGCGPAFVAMMMEALADAGVKYGLPRATAYRLAAQMALGTGKMQLETGMIPAEIKDGVCSPRGTTIRGVEALEANGMRHAFMEAVKATIER